jgi:hypothetical protein
MNPPPPTLLTKYLQGESFGGQAADIRRFNSTANHREPAKHTVAGKMVSMNCAVTAAVTNLHSLSLDLSSCQFASIRGPFLRSLRSFAAIPYQYED